MDFVRGFKPTKYMESKTLTPAVGLRRQAPMEPVQTSLPGWVIDLAVKDAEPHEGKTSVVFRKIIVAHYLPKKPKGIPS